MALPITGQSRFPTSNQVPEHSILDAYNKQNYLGNQFIASAKVVTLADTAEHPVLYLLAPSGIARSLFCGVRRFFSGDLTNTIVFRTYITSTGISAGTAVTPTNCRVLSSTVSLATCKLSPTVSGLGTLVSAMSTGIGYEPIDFNMFILDPTASLLITAQASAATTCAADFVWYEL